MSIWLIPGGVLLGLVLSGIYGAHGLSFIVVAGGTLGLMGAMVHALLMPLAVFKATTKALRILVVFVGTFVLCTAAVHLFLGIPRVVDLAFLGIANLGVAATAVWLE